jgi:hypothetical protein
MPDSRTAGGGRIRRPRGVGAAEQPQADAAPRRWAAHKTLTRARVGQPTQVLQDCVERFVPAAAWLGGGGRDPEAAAERRADALLAANAGVLRDMRIEASVQRRVGRAGILFRPSTRIGAVPLRSPVSGRPDHGLVIEPRISWRSTGDMLCGTGFRIVPELLPFAEMPQSERRVPPWVLSSVVIERLERMLDGLRRRFVTAEADLSAPKGQIRWDDYARTRLPIGRALEVPCRYPDLRDDAEIRSAIVWAARRHRDALATQLDAGAVVRELISRFELILQRLSGVQPRMPTPGLRRAWQSQPVTADVFRQGLMAIDWTVDERGLAGLTDLAGLAWRLDMEVFFEAWVEAISEHAARRHNAVLTRGRRSETRVPLGWKPASLGSQQSLMPDLVIQRAGVAIVIDAKYKRHASQIESLGWQGVDERVREDHRNDILQALAYSTLFDAPRVVSCLAYPAAPEHWSLLQQAGRTIARTRVPARSREVELVLMSVPLSGRPADACQDIERILQG